MAGWKSSPSRDAWDARRREASPNRFCCEHCGTWQLRRLSGTNRASGSKNRWCSMACRKQAAARLRAEVAWVRGMAIAHRCHVRDLATQERAQRPTQYQFACLDCGSAEARPVAMGPRAKRCAVCADVYAAALRRKHKRISKSARRARIRSAPHESIDPIDVFERDRWRCHLCRRSTPRRLRGSIEDAAPELDHVVPLALGGWHTWPNVACSCRACNRAKGATARGQLGLGLVARG